MRPSIFEEPDDLRIASSHRDCLRRPAISAATLYIGPFGQEGLNDLSMAIVYCIAQRREAVLILNIDIRTSFEQHIDNVGLTSGRGIPKGCFSVRSRDIRVHTGFEHELNRFQITHLCSAPKHLFTIFHVPGLQLSPWIVRRRGCATSGTHEQNKDTVNDRREAAL